MLLNVSNDDKTLRMYTVVPYRDVMMKRMRAQDRNLTYLWKFHGEGTSCEVLSIRSYQGNLDKLDPVFGHRLVIQVLVKFDTSQVRFYFQWYVIVNLRLLQSLRVYNKTGRMVAGDTQPKRVVEYLVLQKRGWLDGPWTIRDQLFEGLDNNFRAAA